MTNIRARNKLSSAVHYGSGGATISYVRDAVLVLLPRSELADDEG